jgi:DNA-binding response OmpR family regulator
MPCEELLAAARAADFLGTIGTCQAGVCPNGRDLYGAGPTVDLKCKRELVATKEDAMVTQAAQTKDAMSFGPFRLVASERLLTKEGAPVELGARALDILIALVSSPNEIVSKRDLLSRPTSP